jgi:hypothetical protein
MARGGAGGGTDTSNVILNRTYLSRNFSVAAVASMIR